MDETKLGRQGFYDGAVPAAEAERLRAFKYPDQVSARFLPHDMTGKYFLDVGAGPNPTLQGEIGARHGIYVAFDYNVQLLSERPAGHRVQGDSQFLPFVGKDEEGDKHIDILHERFMLMHMAPEARAKAIKEMDRVGKESMALEWDWASWPENLAVQRRDYQNEPDKLKIVSLSERFITNSRALGAALNIEMDMGRKLESEVETALGRKPAVEIIKRPLETNYGELIQLGGMQIMMWRQKVKNEAKAAELKEIVDAIKELTPDEQAPYCTADIVAVKF